MNEDCGCCEGTGQLTPKPVTNRPGLNLLAYRMGTHAAFLETMKARLSNYFLDIPREGVDENGQPWAERIYPLASLTARTPEDPSIALLDAWATVGDVLTFYQERIANEGYLHTATERRSILELARLVGYALRPGVASTVYLAYTLDSSFKEEVVIPAGARVQSLPEGKEQPQSFETSEVFQARAVWNNLKPRMTQPQTAETIRDERNSAPANGSVHRSTATITQGNVQPRVYLKGINTNLKVNDPLLIDFGGDSTDLYRIMDVKPDATTDRTLVLLQGQDGQDQMRREAFSPPSTKGARNTNAKDPLFYALARLRKRASVPPRSAQSLKRDVARTFEERADVGLQMIAAFDPRLRETAPVALANVKVTEDNAVRVYSFRSAARPFGHNAQPRPDRFDEEKKMVVNGEWRMNNPLNEPKPIAAFRVEPLSQDLSLEFQFTDMSSGDVTSRTWSFGDGVTSTDQNPRHAYSAAGVYTVILKVSGQQVDSYAEALVNVTGPVIGMVAAFSQPAVAEAAAAASPPDQHTPTVVFLDNEYNIKEDGWIVVERAGTREEINLQDMNAQVTQQSLSAYGLTGKTTKLDLKETTWFPAETVPEDFSPVRQTVIHAQSEELELAEEPITDDICKGKDEPIELAGLYNGLQAGRWLIISGERTDIPSTDPNDTTSTEPPVPVSGVRASELVMLAEVRQDVSRMGADGTEALPGDKTHTFIRLAENLSYCYKRDTVTIYANVVKATHGETRNEVLGSGDSSQALQSFTLRQAPLTYVAASNPKGVDSTLHVRVNEVEWHEVESLAELEPTELNFVTRTSDDDKTTIIFGNGQQGARLPTGIENIRATYRSGIGKAGNVKARQISQLMTRPLGVKEVINPLRASGGADKESRDQARKNAPLAVLALDRLVSTRDYADFTRKFAGIGKASAARLSNGNHQLVHVTIAGADDIPIDRTSDLYQSLFKALHDFGDPYLPITLEMRELILIIISSNVRILPDYLWESVATKIRLKLLDTFSFERRELGQDVLLSEVISAIQSVEGVAYVDVDLLGGVSEKNDTGALRTPKEIADVIQSMIEDQTSKPKSRIRVNLAAKNRPAQLAFLTPDVEATLILNEVK